MFDIVLNTPLLSFESFTIVLFIIGSDAASLYADFLL